MKVKLWGVRGSLATPLTNNEYQIRINDILERFSSNSKSIPEFIENLPNDLKYIYGGNTTCITVTSEKGNTYIVDAGTGIRPLGDELINNPNNRGNGVFNIFITHTHWDHIQGLPFFKPIYIPGNKLNFYSPIPDLHERFIYQQKFKFFPKEFDETLSAKEFHLLKLGGTTTFDDGMIIEYYPLYHPGASFAYKFTENGKSFIFATDVEITGLHIEQKNDNMNKFFHDTSLLVIDSQYTLDEAFYKFDWGHTSYTMAVNCGIKWNISKLVLTHHEPSYTDKKLTEIFCDAVHHRDIMESTKPEIFFATEGTVFDV